MTSIAAGTMRLTSDDDGATLSTPIAQLNLDDTIVVVLTSADEHPSCPFRVSQIPSGLHMVAGPNRAVADPCTWGFAFSITDRAINGVLHVDGAQAAENFTATFTAA